MYRLHNLNVCVPERGSLGTRLHSNSIHLQNSVQFRNVANSTGEYLSVIGTRNGSGIFSSKEVAFD